MVNLSFTNTNLLHLNTMSWKTYRDPFGRRTQGSTMYFHEKFFTLHTEQSKTVSGTRKKTGIVMTPAKNFPKSQLPTSPMS